MMNFGSKNFLNDSSHEQEGAKGLRWRTEDTEVKLAPIQLLNGWVLR